MSDVAWIVVAAVVKSAIAIGALLTIFAYMTLVERRVIARFQRRVGPNRAGPLGLLQPLADGMKMAFKEQIIPTKARRLIFVLSPAISVFVALIAFAVVPLGNTTTWGTSPVAIAWAPFIADLNVGVLYMLAISSLAVYGIVLGGWSSGNHYSLLGALRSAAQMVSYEVSIGLALAGVLMLSGTLSMVGIVHAQVAQGIWFILAQPLAFVLYAIAATAEVNRAPFDLPEAEQELVAGYLTEFSGLRWSLYQMAEYINMITVSSIAATLFFGGWTLGGLEGIPGMPFVWYTIKVAIFLFIFIWVRATLPRIRYDQLMKVGWQALLPLSIINLVFTGLAVALGWPWWASGLFGLGVLLIVAVVLYNRLRLRQAMERQSGEAVPLALPSSVRLVRIAPATASESGDGVVAAPAAPAESVTTS
ncbi:MAG: NADH-ubiquinone oxidoreductase chain H [Ktedonobacterales bacterium]|jgi:NADH-quinone oxidoreductase subunit H|nr:MAG: NADH-ubiquinone oxidoreductase chain H [Ktedonobacterales bacterium]